MREQIEYKLVQFFFWITKLLPQSFIYKTIRFLTLLIYRFDSKRRKMTTSNLSKAFPIKTKEEINLLAKQVYIDLSKTVSEILFMFVGKFDIDKAVNNTEEASEKLKQIAENSPHGIIVMTAHFSNWELAAHFLAKHGLPMLAVGRTGDNKLIDENITIPFRNKYGNHATSKKKAMLAMAKTLKKGNAIGLLIDQKAGKDGVKVPFFTDLADTTLSVATLKLKFNPTVVPIFIARQEDGLYELIIKEPIDYIAEEIEDKDEKLKAMTTKYNQVIENIIRAYPSQWFWMHNRWRR